MSDVVDPEVAEALVRVRELADAQLSSLNLPERQLDPRQLQRFAPDLPDVLDAAESRRLHERIDQLGPWLQGPFYLGGDLVIEGTWRNDQRWDAVRHLMPDVAGKRVLDVGSNAGYDPFMFHVLGAAEILGCEPFEFIEQARFLESVYRTGITFAPLGWQRLDPATHGLFDVVHCNGVLYHEPDPLGMLVRLRSMVADGGTLMLGSMMLASAELSEYARFVRSTYAEDPTWWWVPGRLALRRMMDACGFETEPLSVRFDGPMGDFSVVNGYIRGTPKTPDPHLAVGETIARRAADSVADEPVNRFPIGVYYSPMYDTREVSRDRERIWPRPPRRTHGIRWRDAEQLELCRGVFAVQEKLVFRESPGADETEYHASNDQFPPLDAWVLAGLLEHTQPQRMIEVGCGFSTLVSARVNRERLGGTMRLTCIEPYPRQFLLDGVPGVSDLRIERIQDTPLEVFDDLRGGDVLFIDTAHTVKTGGDVVWIFQEILPRLSPGVLVHIHDVFMPGDYPEPWVMEGWGWNETYLVRAFLSFNSAFEIVWGQQYMLENHRGDVLAAFPGLAADTASGASLWIRRVGALED